MWTETGGVDRDWTWAVYDAGEDVCTAKDQCECRDRVCSVLLDRVCVQIETGCEDSLFLVRICVKTGCADSVCCW